MLQFVFDKVIDVPVVQVVLAMSVVANDRCAGSDLQNPVEVPQKQFCVVVDVPVTIGGNSSSQQRRVRFCRVWRR